MRRPVLFVAIVALAACAGAPPSPPASSPRGSGQGDAPPAVVVTHETVHAAPELSALTAAPDRSAEDRALDAGRRPAELFTFAGVKRGMHVAEIGAWQGYTAELLARAVAPDGIVYAEDPADFDKWTRAAWQERAKRPTFARIVRVARPFDAPLAEGTPPIDIALCILFYHDTVWLGVDRAKMNAAIFGALKPGGAFIVVDHSARKGDGLGVVKSLHRIEESLVVTEVARAGFVLAADRDFLRHAEDTRDWSASDEAPPEKRGTSDRFVLRFVKP